MSELAIVVRCQRQLLSGVKLEEFDLQWGILRSSEAILSRMQANILSDLTFVSGMFEKIYNDVKVVRNRAVAKIETLRVTTEQ